MGAGHWGLQPKDIEKYVNKIGNLTMVHKKINSIIGNKVISDKINALKNSGVAMTQNLVCQLEKTKYQWGEDEINKRQDDLVKVAYYRAWQID